MTKQDIEIDWEQLHELSGHDAAFEQELLQLFIEDSLAQLTHLQQAWSQENFPGMRRIAHHIKGASANVGAVQISQSAAQIELAARDAVKASIQVPLEELTRSLHRLQHYLENQ
ncbi:MAG TPA: Hpt domain-containing protein [Leptolyngbyaceae cyanobacterium]